MELYDPSLDRLNSVYEQRKLISEKRSVDGHATFRASSILDTIRSRRDGDIFNSFRASNNDHTVRILVSDFLQAWFPNDI